MISNPRIAAVFATVALISACGPATPPENKQVTDALGGPKVLLELRVVDSSGVPVPFATLGRLTVGRHAASPSPTLQDYVAHELSEWEYANRYQGTNSVIDYAGVTNRDGKLIDDLAWRAGGIALRLEPVEYLVHRRGYSPTINRVDVEAALEARRSVRLTVPTPDSRPVDPPYLQALYEARIANDALLKRRGEPGAYLHAENLFAKLEVAKAQALAANDKVSAAAIVYWMALVPGTSNAEGGMVVPAANTTGSSDYLAALEGAMALDPRNPFYAGSYMSHKFEQLGRLRDSRRISESDWHASVEAMTKDFEWAWRERPEALTSLGLGGAFKLLYYLCRFDEANTVNQLKLKRASLSPILREGAMEREIWGARHAAAMKAARERGVRLPAQISTRNRCGGVLSSP